MYNSLLNKKRNISVGPIYTQFVDVRAQLVIIPTGNVVLVEIGYLFMSCSFQESLSSLLSSFALAGEESLFLQKFILSVVDPQSKPTQTLQAFVNSLSGYFKVIQSSKTKSMNHLALICFLMFGDPSEILVIV